MDDEAKSREQLLQELTALRQKNDAAATRSRDAEELSQSCSGMFGDLFNHLRSGGIIYEVRDNGNKFVFLDMNLAAEKIEKMKKENVRGKSVIDVFPQIAGSGLLDVFFRVWKTGIPEFHPATFYQDKRISGWRENFVYKLPTGEIVVIYDDVTGRIKAEEALRESDKRFMDVIYMAQDAILLIDGQKFVDCNEATARMLGYATRAEFLMTHPSKLSLPRQPDGRDSFEKANEMMKLALEKGFQRFEWIHTRANGENFPVDVSLTPIVLRGNGVLHCLWRDLTEVRKVEAVLFESDDRFKSLLDNVNLGITTIGTDYKIKEVNASQAKSFQKSASEFVGKECFREFEKRDAVCAHCPGKKAMETGCAAEAEAEGVRDDGSRFTVRIHASPLYDKDGVCAGFMEVVEDISEQKRKEKEQAVQLRELKIFSETSMNREERILELKKRVKELEKKLEEKKL